MYLKVHDLIYSQRDAAASASRQFLDHENKRKFMALITMS